MKKLILVALVFSNLFTANILDDDWVIVEKPKTQQEKVCDQLCERIEEHISSELDKNKSIEIEDTADKIKGNFKKAIQSCSTKQKPLFCKKLKENRVVYKVIHGKSIMN